MFNPSTLVTALLSSLVLFSSMLIPPEAAAPVMKPMPFEDEYITEIAAIDYPEERIEAYTDGGMVEYIRDKRAEPSPSPTFWPIEEIITTTHFPEIEEDGVIEVIRDKRKAEHAVMFRPIKEYISTTLFPVLEDEGMIEVIRDKREAAKPGAQFWPIREAITTARRPIRKGNTQQAHRNRRAEPSPSSRPYLKEYITSQPHETGKPYFEEDIITTVTYPVIYDSGFFIRPKRSAESGFFQQCLSKLLGVGVGVAVVAALIYYFWYRRLRRAREQGDEVPDYEDRQPYSKRRGSHRNLRDDERANNYTYQASPG